MHSLSQAEAAPEEALNATGLLEKGKQRFYMCCNTDFKKLYPEIVS